jgi:hypothetical protein
MVTRCPEGVGREKMKIIVAGSRSISDEATVHEAILSSGLNFTELVSGGAKGVDSTAEALAKEYGLPVKRFLPNWKKHGKSAGPLRNKQMADYADALVAIWDGKSRGTKNMVDTMNKLGKPVHLVLVQE